MERGAFVVRKIGGLRYREKTGFSPPNPPSCFFASAQPVLDAYRRSELLSDKDLLSHWT